MTRWSSAILFMAFSAAPALAQERPTLEITPHAGYIVFGDLWQGPVGTRLTAGNGAFYGVQGAVNLTDALAITASVGQARTDLRIGVPILGGLDVGDSETTLYDAGIQLQLPGRTTRPFLQAGAGMANYRLRAGPIDVDASNPAFHIGAGVDMDLTRSIGLRIQARDYIGRFDFADAILYDLQSETAHNLALTVGLRVGF